MQKEKPINTPNRQEEAPQLPGPYDNLGSDTPLPLPQLGVPNSFEFGASLETQQEKVTRSLGEVALTSTVVLEGSSNETIINPEAEDEKDRLKEYAIENLETFNLADEHKQQIAELLNKTNQETLAARRVVETILADDTIVSYLNGGMYQLGGEFDYDLVADTKSRLIRVAQNAENNDYQPEIDDFIEFFESTNLAYMEAMDSGYPKDLLIESRLKIFSRYSANGMPLEGTSLVEFNVDKALKSFNTAKDLGEGASVLKDIDSGIAKTILQDESYRRDKIENYDYLDSEKCLDIARSIERIKGHDDKAYAQSGLNALRHNMGRGYVSYIHMAEFMNDLISSDKLKHLKERGTLATFARNEIRRFEDSNDSENFIRGVEEVIDWCSEAGYDYESNYFDMIFVNDIAFGVSVSSSPETLVQNFKNLEFIDRLNGSLESSDREEFRKEIIADLFGGSCEWMMINNPEIINETYSLYDHQELKKRNDFRLLLHVKQRINEEFSWLNEDFKTQVSSHFDENYTKYIDRTDKDGNRFDSVWSIYHAVDDSYRYRNEKGLNPDTLKWFESSSELPMFAYASVARMRSEAVSHGVEDNPGAVYDFIYNDPDMVSQLSSINRDEYIKSTIVKDYEYVQSLLPGVQSDRRISDEEKFNQLKSRYLKEAYSRQESFRTFINLSKDTLEMVSGADMKLKSILDTDVQVDHGDAYNERRSGVEIALGIRSMNSNDPHPIYGSVGFVDRGYPDGAWGYGEVMLVVNDEDMNSRSTFTSADSFHGANRLTREDAMIVRAAKDINKVGHTKTTDYVEAQIRGSVDVMKAEKICVEDYGTADNLRSFLPEELHDRIIVRPVDKNLSFF